MADMRANEEDIFKIAQDIKTPESRERYLQMACGDDELLKQRVIALLKVTEEEASFLEVPVAEIVATEIRPLTEQPGDTIGPYKLLQQIGEGGMGTVFMAEQTKPVERRVALKIIKPGMDTQQVIARFEAERQALAMMDHPNIAKVLDAGQTDSGRPYFVMELVKGMSVTQYCDEQHLSPRERLELFVPICQAVQHAHQKGIIHRDLKPSNILIAQYDDKPVAKIIDFGVAKAVSHKLTKKTMFTQYGQIVGTIEYMSPEQAQFNQLDVDTRSDVYSLGVLLYELLTGETPFDKQRLRSAAFDELLRIIREEEPPRPSTRLSSSATLANTAINRKMEPKKLSVLVRGELDWIVMKALEKDRGRRYETACKFSEDVQNYLNDEAVEACPPSAGYKFRKFARRNKVAMGTTAAIAASLIAGIIGTGWQAYEAGQERDRAVTAEGLAEKRLIIVESQKNVIEKEKQKAITEANRADQEAAIAKAVRDFLEDDLLGLAGAAAQIDAEVVPDPNIKLRTIVERAAVEIEARFTDQPKTKSAIFQLIGNIYLSLGEYQKAEEFYQRAVKIGTSVWEDEDIQMLRAELRIAHAKITQIDLIEAETICRRILPIVRRKFGVGHKLTLETMNHLANALFRQEKYQSAEMLHREVLKISQQVFGSNHSTTLFSMNNLGITLKLRGKHKQSESILRETLQIRQQIFGDEHPETLISKSNLANTLKSQGHFKDAEALVIEVLETRKRVLGPEHPRTLISMNSLANSFSNQGREQEAETLYRETLDMKNRVFGPEHPETLNGMHNLAISLLEQGRAKEAEKFHREALEVQQRVLGPEHSDSLRGINNLAVCLKNQGHLQESAALYRKTLEIRQRIYGSEHPRTLISMHNLANLQLAQHQASEAEKSHRETLAIRQRVLDSDHPDIFYSMNSLGLSLDAQEKYQEAETVHRETLKNRQRVLGSEHPHTLQSMINLAVTLSHLKKHHESEILKREALEISERVFGIEHPMSLLVMNNLAVQLSRQKHYEESETLHRTTLEVRTRILGSEHPDTLMSMGNVALALNQQGKHEEAELLRLKTLEISRRVLGADHPLTLSSAYDLGVWQGKQGLYIEAAESLRGALKLHQNSLGNDHPETLICQELLAIVLKELQKYREAEKHRSELVEISRTLLGVDHPDTLRRMYRLGVCQEKLARWIDAEETLREALALHQQSLGNNHSETLKCQILLAFVLARLENFQEAETLYRQSVEGAERVLGKDAPETLFWKKNFAAFLTRRTWHLAVASDSTERNPTEAVRMGTLACELQPGSANNWNNLGVAQYRAGNFDAALEALLKADGMIDGGDRFHRMFLAMTLWQLERKEEAQQRYKEAVVWMAANKKDTGEQFRFRAEAEELLGIDAKRRDDLIAEYYSDPPPANATAAYWKDRERWHNQRGEYEQSVADLTHAIELEPGNGYFYKRRGLAFTRLKRWDEALSDLNEAIHIDSKDVWAHIMRSEIHRNLNLLDEALADAKQATALDEKNQRAWKRLAQVHEAQQEWGFAAEAHGKFFEIDPDDSSCWIPYANALLASGQLEEYRTFCTELVEQNADTEDPQTAQGIIFCLNKAPDAVADWTVPLRLAELVLASEKSSMNHVSLLFGRAGQYRRSIELQEQAIQASQRDLNAWDCLRLGLAYHGLGEFKQAQRSLDQADKMTAQDTTLAEDSNYQKLRREVSELLASQTAAPKEEKKPITQNVVSEEAPEM